MLDLHGYQNYNHIFYDKFSRRSLDGYQVVRSN